MQLSIPDATGGNYKIGEFFHLVNFTPQDGDLEAIVVIQMHMHAGERKVVVIMLHRSDAACQIALMVVVYIAERGYAVTPSFFQARGFQMFTYQVAHGFRSVGVAARAYKLVKLLRKLVI
jgi:hypothetical protein